MVNADGFFTTPYLEIDLDKIKSAYERLHRHLHNIEIYYAMKCNPNPEIMRTVLNCGGNFEVASANEIKSAVDIGADPKTIIFSNPVKTIEDIKSAHQSGVKYYAFDSYCEVDKIAKYAPGANVYVRLAIPVRKSVVASEGKFGVSIEQGRDLMIYARKCGLYPYGISFHVGSQMLDNRSWEYAIQHCIKLIDLLDKDGIHLTFLDIGGGFPACYNNVRQDNLEIIGNLINRTLEDHISKDVRIVAEPGRYLVADSGIMVSTVIGLAERYDKKWLHLDVGAINGLFEALETRNTLEFPVNDSKQSKDKNIFNLTGPTCDSQDTILFDVPISSNIEVGSKVYFACAGAYTTAYTDNFNGFPNPKIYFVENKKG